MDVTSSSWPRSAPQSGVAPVEAGEPIDHPWRVCWRPAPRVSLGVGGTVRIGHQFDQFGEVELSELTGLIFTDLAVAGDAEHHAGVRHLDLPHAGHLRSGLAGEAFDLGLLASVEDLRHGDGSLEAAEQHRWPVAVLVPPERFVDPKIACLEFRGGQERPPFY